MDENQNSQPDGVSPSELEEHFSETSSEARKNSLSDIVNESLHREEAEAKREEVEFQETKKRLEEERKRKKSNAILSISSQEYRILLDIL